MDKEIVKPLKVQQKWEKVLDRKENWNSVPVYKNLAKTIQEPKIRIFCYKFYHRCVPTNKFLFQKIKEVTSPL